MKTLEEARAQVPAGLVEAGTHLTCPHEAGKNCVPCQDRTRDVLAVVYLHTPAVATCPACYWARDTVCPYHDGAIDAEASFFVEDEAEPEPWWVGAWFAFRDWRHLGQIFLSLALVAVYGTFVSVDFGVWWGFWASVGLLLASVVCYVLVERDDAEMADDDEDDGDW